MIHHQYVAFGIIIHNSKRASKLSPKSPFIEDTVDGRNPASPWMVETLSIME